MRESDGNISVAIPTYGRDEVLLDTIASLCKLVPGPSEIIVLDQTPSHTPSVDRALEDLAKAGTIRWLRLSNPSIPGAMNRGLVEAKNDLVLFLDDDIVAEPGLIAAHQEAHRLAAKSAVVAGRVIQPWQEGLSTSAGTDGGFASALPRTTDTFMGGNFSVSRSLALSLGAFDENFVRVAYNFEMEFAYRWRDAGWPIVFAPAACIHHLKVASGGTRSYGHHLTTVSPGHAVGAYYSYLRTWSGLSSMKSFAARPFRSVATRHHIRRPWWIAPTLVAEIAGMAWAIRLALAGPKYATRNAAPAND